MLCACLLAFAPSKGQDQKVADSLLTIYQRDTAHAVVKMELLRNLAYNELRDLDKAQYWAEELIRLAEKEGNKEYLQRGYFQLGNKLRVKGNYDKALAAYFKSAELARMQGSSQGEGIALNAVGDVYSQSGNQHNAREYYRRGIATLQEHLNTNKDSIYLASALFNAGDAIMLQGEPDTAMVYFRQALRLFEHLPASSGKAYVLGDMGMIESGRGQDQLAERHLNDAIPELEENEDYPPLCTYLLTLADLRKRKGDLSGAEAFAKRSLELAKARELKKEISEADLKLSEISTALGDPERALLYFKDHIAYRDSLDNLASIKKMSDLRANFEISKRDAEVTLLNQQKKSQRNALISLAVILALITALLSLLFTFYRRIAKEKKRSDTLLLNILPSETAQELKLTGKVEAIKFDQVTVLFTDFVGFSKLAEHAEPVHLVRSIDFYFKAFDQITTKHGLEKIKTIGDAYMCASGLPKANRSQARHVVEAAREMMDFVNREMNSADGLTHFEIRIGIHTGPVVAGIVGIKKWQYDIWGDTVNIASRMESMSEPGQINLSETTYQQIKDEFPCTYRGEIAAKNRGLLKMYYLS
jgi:class 3 adenylate cyclase/tetratricopeptide (TPR) repeat protein